MTITLREILEVNQGLTSIAGKELPSKLSYSLARLQSKVTEPLKTFENARNGLIKKYGAEQEDKTLKVTDANMEVFINEINGIMNVDEVIDFAPMNIALFDGQSFPKEFFIVMNKFITE
jgi:hypothetical protein